MNDEVDIDVSFHIDREIFLKAVNGDEESQKTIYKAVAYQSIEIMMKEFAQAKLWIDLEKAKRFNI